MGAPILERTRLDPRAVALDDGERQRSFGDLWERATRFAHVLREAGVGPGDHAAALLGNRVECSTAARTPSSPAA